MLVNLKKVLDYAQKNDCAVGAFNTPTLESLMAVLSAAEKNNVPVIISHAQCHEQFMPLDVIGPIMIEMAKKACIDVCVHLDHGEDLEYLKRAVNLGFTSIMYDCSQLSYEENVKNTKLAVEMAHKVNVSVEAEIGTLSTREGQGEGGKAQYTDPDLAIKFINETGIDALAASFGTAHGYYKSAPKLDFERINKIHKKTQTHLVMHGGSGLADVEYTKAINNGIRKINYYSYMAFEGSKRAKEMLEIKDNQFYHEVAYEATQTMQHKVDEVIKVFINK